MPGGAAARVKITAVTPRGTYQPTGGNGISLLGRLTTGIAMPSLSGFPGSIKVSANVPVTAVLEVSGGPAGSPGAFISGSAPITEQGVVAAAPAGSGGHDRDRAVGSGQGGERADHAGGALATPLTGQSGQVVKIAARSATEVKLKLPKQASKTSLMAVVVTPLPGSGPVYAARVALIGGSVVTVLPIASSPTMVNLPACASRCCGCSGRKAIAGRVSPLLDSRGRSSAGQGRAAWRTPR